MWWLKAVCWNTLYLCNHCLSLSVCSRWITKDLNRIFEVLNETKLVEVQLYSKPKGFRWTGANVLSAVQTANVCQELTPRHFFRFLQNVSFPAGSFYFCSKSVFVGLIFSKIWVRKLYNAQVFIFVRLSTFNTWNLIAGFFKPIQPTNRSTAVCLNHIPFVESDFF